MTSKPFTEQEALAYIDGLRAALAVERARAEAAERRLAEIADLAEMRWDINRAGNHDPEHLVKRIEAIAARIDNARELDGSISKADVDAIEAIASGE